MGLKKKLEQHWMPMMCEDGTEQDLDREGYIAELKVDGCHCTIERDANGLRIHSRRGLLYNETLPEIYEPFSKIRGYFRMEGEIVYVDEDGHMVFAGAQKRCQISKAEKVEKYRKLYPIGLYLYEITSLNGEDLTAMPYIKRRLILTQFFNLQNTLIGFKNIRLIPTSPDKRKLYKWATEKGYEGVVCKKLLGIYTPNKRTYAFIKVKIREHTIWTLNKKDEN